MMMLNCLSNVNEQSLWILVLSWVTIQCNQSKMSCRVTWFLKIRVGWILQIHKIQSSFLLILVLSWAIIHCSEKKMSNAREKSFSNWVVFQVCLELGPNQIKNNEGILSFFTCAEKLEGFWPGRSKLISGSRSNRKIPFQVQPTSKFGLRIIGLRLNLLVTVEKSKGLFDDDRRSFCYFSISRK